MEESTAAKPATPAVGTSVAVGPRVQERQRGASQRTIAVLARYGGIATFVIVIAVFSILRPETFPTIENVRSILMLAAPYAVLAGGLTVVVIMNDFDLSFGATLGLSGAVAIVLITGGGAPAWLAIVAALLVGALVGAINGLIIAFGKLSSFIITLGTGTLILGVEYVVTGQRTIYGQVPEFYAALGQGTFLGLSNQVWVAASVLLVLYVVLVHTEPGRYIHAIGGNPEAARLSGISVRWYRWLGFVILGLCAGIAGILITSQASSSTPNIGVSYLLPTYAAIFLGATMARRGRVSIVGTTLGVLFLGVIQTGLIMLQLTTAIVNIVQGAVLILAILIGKLSQRA
jgi:ribose transport system permease protein